MTQEEFAEAVGVSRNYVSMLERGAKEVSRTSSLGILLQRLGEESGASTAGGQPECAKGAKPNAPRTKEPDNVYLIEGVAAGEDALRPVMLLSRRGMVSVENVQLGDLCMAIPGDGVFCAIRQQGDAMAPDVMSGDLVVVDWSQGKVRSGDIGLVALRNGDAMVRRVQRAAGMVRLVATNPALVPEQISEADVEWMKPVIGIWRRLDEL